MTPITEPIQKYELTDKQKKIKAEIEEFMAHPCEMAYVWTDDTVTISRSRERYKSMLRKMRLSGIVRVRQRNKMIYLTKIKKGE